MSGKNPARGEIYCKSYHVQRTVDSVTSGEPTSNFRRVTRQVCILSGALAARCRLCLHHRALKRCSFPRTDLGILTAHAHSAAALFFRAAMPSVQWS